MTLPADIIQIQTLINSGMAWQFEGHVGRTCMAAIENGDAMLGLTAHRDYWGNYVPSRNEVKEGTKGSIGRVEECNGPEYALELAAVGSDVMEVML